MSRPLTLVECPRDAMQGWNHFIPTAEKVAYLNALLRVGFDVLDCGSFVSPKAIPQMADTKDVLPQLNLSDTQTKILVIVANTRGAQEAVGFEQVRYLGFPFSISETFQQRNTNKSIAESLVQVEEMQSLCVANNKELVVYISMGFGNPYGDPYDVETACHWVKQLTDMGIKTISIADTVGVATPDVIERMFAHLIPAFPEVSIGAHFHSTPYAWEEKLQTAFAKGCIRFDSALKGIGGCPMAKDELVGNIATENLLYWAEKQGVSTQLNPDAFQTALQMAGRIFA